MTVIRFALTRRAMLAGAAAAAVPLTARAQTFPSQAIRMVVPYPPAGPTDAFARIIAQELQAASGWTVVVDNKAGADGAIAAEGIARFLRSEALDKRPKIDVHGFDLMRKMVEKGLKVTQVGEPTWGTDSSTGAIHNYDNRSDRYVIPHNELFLGHFNYTPRVKRKMISLSADEALNNFEERLLPLLEAQAQAEAKRCMSCGQCFECDNCVVYCPQTAVFKVPKGKSTMGRYVDTDYTKCIGCHICADVCPTGYIQMGLGE